MIVSENLGSFFEDKLKECVKALKDLWPEGQVKIIGHRKSSKKLKRRPSKDQSYSPYGKRVSCERLVGLVTK